MICGMLIHHMKHVQLHLEKQEDPREPGRCLKYQGVAHRRLAVIEVSQRTLVYRDVACRGLLMLAKALRGGTVGSFIEVNRL